MKNWVYKDYLLCNNFKEIDSIDDEMWEFLDKKFSFFLFSQNKKRKHYKKYMAAIYFMLVNLFHRIENFPDFPGIERFFEESEGEQFIAPVDTTQSGQIWVGKISFSSEIVWRVIKKALSGETPSPYKLLKYKKGKFIEDKKIRYPSRIIPFWTEIRKLYDEFKECQRNTTNLQKHFSKDASLRNKKILDKILATEGVEVRRKVPQADKRKREKTEVLYTEKFANEDLIIQSGRDVSKIRKFTKKIEISLSSFDDVSDALKDEILIEYQSAKKQVIPDNAIFKIISDEIKKVNENLAIYRKHEFPCKRIFYLHQDREFFWGRFYGFPSDYLTRWQKLLLRINNKPAVELDIQSCIPQIACMKFTPDADYTQDMYLFPSLKQKYNIGRDEIKSMFMSLINTKNINKWKANKIYKELFSYPFMDKEKNKENLRKKYNDITTLMVKDKPFMKYLIGNQNEYKRLVFDESEFMRECMMILISENIKFLYNFDCFIVAQEDIDSTKSIMKSVSLRKWGKEIFLKENNDFIPSVFRENEFEEEEELFIDI